MASSSRLQPLCLSALLLLLLLTPCLALFCGKQNCYDLLQVPRNASKLHIRRSYRRLSSETHPDKHPNDKLAAERFRALSAAYEALLDDEKRAKYDDFLDHPAKYWQFLASLDTDVYAPKSNALVVVAGIIAVATLVHWLNLHYSYNSTVRRVKQSRQYQQHVTRLLKSKQAKDRQHAEQMIQLDVDGLQQPQWTDLLVFKLLRLPRLAFDTLRWHLKWFVMYRVRRLQYSQPDKLYLIQRNMSLTDQQWQATSDKDKQMFLNEQLWQQDKCDQYLRRRRIQLNRLGKTNNKNKKKNTYSAPDTLVNTSE